MSKQTKFNQLIVLPTMQIKSLIVHKPIVYNSQNKIIFSTKTKNKMELRNIETELANLNELSEIITKRKEKLEYEKTKIYENIN